MAVYNKGYALIIGVGYDMPITAKDAVSIAAFLEQENHGGFDPDNIFLHTEEDANPNKILFSLNNLIKKAKSNPDVPVYVYYSGHGAVYEEDEEYYLLLHGYDEYNKDTTMLKGSVFAEKINELSSSAKLLVMLDCCHADGMNNKREFIGKEASGRSLIGAMKNDGQGKIFLSSCDDNEKSLAAKDGENSLFTKLLLEALEGANSGDAEQVHVIDVLSHILKKVPEAANELKSGHSQTPVISEVKKLDSNFYICANSLKDEQTGPGISDKDNVVYNYHNVQQLFIDNATGPMQINADKVYIQFKGLTIEVPDPINKSELRQTGEEFKDLLEDVKSEYLGISKVYAGIGLAALLIGATLFLILDLMAINGAQVMEFLKWFFAGCGAFIMACVKIPFTRVESSRHDIKEVRTQIIRIRSYPQKAYVGIDYLMQTEEERKDATDIQNAFDAMFKKKKDE